MNCEFSADELQNLAKAVDAFDRELASLRTYILHTPILAGRDEHLTDLNHRSDTLFTLRSKVSALAIQARLERPK